MTSKEDLKKQILYFLREHKGKELITPRDLAEELGEIDLIEDSISPIFEEALEELIEEGKIKKVNIEGKEYIVLIESNRDSKFYSYITRIFDICDIKVSHEFLELKKYFTVGTIKGKICILFNNQVVFTFGDLLEIIESENNLFELREKIINTIAEKIQKIALAFLGKEYNLELLKRFAGYLYGQMLLILRSENVQVLEELEELSEEIARLLSRCDALIDPWSGTLWIKAHKAKILQERYPILKYGFITKRERVSWANLPESIKKWLEENSKINGEDFERIWEEDIERLKRNKYTWYIYSIEKLKSAKYTAGKKKIRNSKSIKKEKRKTSKILTSA